MQKKRSAKMTGNLLMFVLILAVFSVFSVQAHPPWGIAVDEDKNIYFADIFHNERGTIWKLTVDGKLIAVFKNFHSHNVSLDKNGNLYAAHGEGEHRLVKVSRDGKTIETLIKERDEEKFYGGNTTVSPNGNIYFGIRKHIWKFEKDKAPVKFNPHELEWNQTVFVDREENIYVPDKAVGGGTIFKLTADGKIEKIAENLISKLERPFDKYNDVLLGIGKDDQGNLYIGETAGRRIIKILKDGKHETFYTSEENYLPTGITFFENEAYILEFGESSKDRGPRIIKIAENGKKTQLFDYDKYKEPVAIDPPTNKNLEKNSAFAWLYFLIFPAACLIGFIRFRKMRSDIS